MENTFIATYFDWDHRTPREGHRLANRVLNKLRLNGRVIPKTPGMSSVETRMNIFHLASQTAAYKVAGDVVEVGCNSGESSIVIQKVLHECAPEKQFHVFDSFEGLPELQGQDLKDGIYDKGSMTARLEEFKKTFPMLGWIYHICIKDGSRIQFLRVFQIGSALQLWTAISMLLPNMFYPMCMSGSRQGLFAYLAFIMMKRCFHAYIPQVPSNPLV